MPLSYVQYVGDGVTDSFNIPFPYISKSHIEVRVDGVLDTAVTFPTNSTVKTSSIPASGLVVEVRRVTPSASKLVDFQDGTLLSESDLDKSSDQILFVMQETVDSVGTKLPLDTASNKWDSQNRVIKNISNGVEPGDAVNYAQTMTLVDQATTEASNAASSASSASSSALTAQNWATKTTGTVDGSSYSSKEYAQGSQANTGGSAKDWATKAENSAVITSPSTKYSAYHWAQKASQSSASINMPSMIGNGTRYVRAKADETGFEYRTSVQSKADFRDIGEISDYAGSSAPPGWLLSYGQAVSRTTYASLFSLLGTTYGAGNGSTTFNLPDLRGRVAIGKDNMGGSTAGRVTSASTSGSNAISLGGVGGDETHTLTVSQMPAHDHSMNYDAISQAGTNRSSPSSTGGSITTGWINSTGGGAPHSNTQPWISLNKIIFTGV